VFLLAQVAVLNLKLLTADQLASCLIYAQPFRHTTLPQMTTPWLAAQATTWQMI